MGRPLQGWPIFFLRSYSSEPPRRISRRTSCISAMAVAAT